MKIGILTFHEANNYGAILQAYSLERILSGMDCDPEIINYHQPYIVKNYRPFYINMSSAKKMVESLLYSILHYNIVLRKNRKFDKFRTEFMTISNQKYKYGEFFDNKDAFIVGSDQVWNGEITRYDDTFFLRRVNPDAVKISYAASLGKDNLTNEQLEYIRENVDNIDYLSIRENSGVKIVKEIVNKNVEHVLDPTLLADIDVWSDFLKPNKKSNPYILVYMIHHNDEVLKVANNLAKRLNCEVLYIKDSLKPTQFKFKHIRGVGPIEYLSLIYNAKFVVTNSFHGTAFSIVFNKNFVTVPHKTMGTRMISLLETLKLSDRIIVSNRDIREDFKLNINYSEANRILQKEKQKSYEFLLKSLNLRNDIKHE